MIQWILNALIQRILNVMIQRILNVMIQRILNALIQQILVFHSFHCNIDPTTIIPTNQTPATKSTHTNKTQNATPCDDSTDRSCILTTLPEPAWNPEPLSALISAHTALSALSSPLATGLFSHLESAALAALLHYVDVTQMGSFPRVFLEEQETLGVLELDRNTRESLNLTRGSHDSPLGSVLHVGPAGVSSPDHRRNGHGDGQPFAQ